MSALEEVLSFWFAPDHQAYWFEKNAAFDEAVRQTLGGYHEAAGRGVFDSWADLPRGALALVILLDQVPRNIFRGQPKAFACDAKAREVTKQAIQRGFDRGFEFDQRKFFYMPLEHSEDIVDQELCCRLMAQATDNPRSLFYADRHREIIQRFGRFPHRNACLGRISTPEEEAFLQEPHSSF